ncbi:MAG: YitT family protein, partial [Clostridia bacterium]|nr:YitT family protein [Clostridia bacterium]
MQVAPGGISGLASAVCDITGNIFPVGGLMLLFNLPLFWAGLKRFGRTFFFESLCG